MKKIKKDNIDATIAFTWEKNNSIPQITHTNITNKNVNDVFALTVENLLSNDPQYFPLLLAQINTIYDFMYGTKTTIN